MARIGEFPITNSMIATWVVAIALIIFAQVATRNIQQVPAGAQNFWEWLVESLHNFLEGIIGHKLVQKDFLVLRDAYSSLFCSPTGRG